MNDRHERTWEAYVSAWRAPSADEKRATLRASVADECEYRDPLIEAKGHEPLIAYMVDFHKQVPGGHFVTTYFLAHHDRSIAKWNMVDGSGTVIGDGTSYGQYRGDGKLVAMTGFFEVPESGS